MIDLTKSGANTLVPETNIEAARPDAAGIVEAVIKTYLKLLA
jgi:hypothetical protein